jgi:hypothetical protein
MVAGAIFGPKIAILLPHPSLSDFLNWMPF